MRLIIFFFYFLSNLNCQEQSVTIQKLKRRKRMHFLLDSCVTHCVTLFHKFINDGFRVVITWKTSNIRSLFLLKDKHNYKSYIYSLYIYICIYFETVSPTTVLPGLLYQKLQQMLRPRRTRSHHILLYGKVILTN